MSKLDLKKSLKSLYQPSGKEISVVDVPSMRFAMVDGAGDPNTSKDFTAAIEALYGVSYTLKFMLKQRTGFPDYGVMPLEGLWWADDMNAFMAGRKDLWRWTAMIVQPDFVTEDHFREAADLLEKRKKPPALGRVRFETFHEGLSARILYTGPYSEEGPTIARMHEFIRNSGRLLRGKHHEIYLSDMRRTAPEKLKTIIRQPME